MSTVRAVRAKALGYLRDGAVTVVHARSSQTTSIYVATEPFAPYEVVALVQGHSGRHVVDYLDGVWTCTCPAGGGCAHVAAVQLVTGHPSEAARERAA